MATAPKKSTNNKVSAKKTAPTVASAEATPAPAEEETTAEEEAVNPFAGKWEAVSVTRGETELPLKELLQADSLTVEVAEEGSATLVFGNGFTVTMDPVYEGDSLSVHYTEYDHDMTWTAVVNGDGTATAVYDKYTLQLQKTEKKR